mmetsp:Transcript_20103/g.17803  ORF Transcript_20103/g.17803 Transcript_20103/m.17803 type:complete len:176 (-) Transcript_20103:3-530(-)
MKVSGVLHQYQVVGRRSPSKTIPHPAIFRMKLFAPNEVVAKSRFWYFLTRLRNLKKANGEIMSVNEIFETRPGRVENYAVHVRYDSRTGTHNYCKEFRALTINEAVTQCYRDLAARHRVRGRSVQIVRVAKVAAKDCKRAAVTEFHDSNIKFPLAHRVVKAKSKYTAKRPSTFFQ